MAGNRVPYIIDLMVSDEKLRKEMSKLDWESILGSKGKGFGDVLAKGAKESEQEIRATLGGLDWSKLLGEKQLQALQQSVARVFQSSKKQIDEIMQLDSSKIEAGLKNIFDLVAGLVTEMSQVNSPMDGWGKDAPRMVQSFSSLMKVVDQIAPKLDSLAQEPAKISAAFDNLLSINPFDGVVDDARAVEVELHKIAKAININADLEDVEKHLSTTLNALKKASKKASFPEIKINYSANDDELIKQLSKQNDSASKDIESQLSLRMSTLSEAYGESIEGLEKLTAGTADYKIKAAELVPVLKEMLLVEQRYKKLGKDDSLLFDAGLDFDDDDIFNSSNNVRKKIKDIFDGLKEEIDKISSSLKDVQKKWTDDLSNINLKLVLTKEDEIEFKNSVDTYVKKLNAGEFGKIEPVTVGMMLDMDDSDHGEKLKSYTLEQIKEQKEKFIEEEKRLNQQITDLEAEFANNTTIIESKDSSKYAVNKAKSVNKSIEQEISGLKKNIAEYQYILANMDDPDFASTTTTSWKKFNAVQKSLEAQQGRILSKTREWRNELSQNLTFDFKWTPKIDDKSITQAVNKINLKAKETPVILVPDTDSFILDVQEALNNHEFTLNIASNGQVAVTGGFVPTARTRKPDGSVTTNKKHGTTPTQSSAEPKDDAKANSVSEVVEQTKTVLDANTDAIIKFANEYKESREKAVKKLEDILDGTGLTASSSQKDINAYFASIQSNNNLLPANQRKKYGSINTYISAVKNAQGGVKGQNQYFDEAINSIISEANKLADSPELAGTISTTIKNLLIEAIKNSILGLEDSFKRQRDRNDKNIAENEKKYKSAMETYGSDEEKQKRATAIQNAESEKNSILEANEVLRDYFEIRQEISSLEDKLKTKNDKQTKDDLEFWRELEKEALPGTRAQYEELLKVLAKIDALHAEAPNDENLVAAKKAQKAITDSKNRNRNIDRRLQAYGHIGLPMTDSEKYGSGLFSILSSSDTDKISDYIIKQIIGKADIVSRMGSGRKFSGSSDTMFGAEAQKALTQTINLVQKALGVDQHTVDRSAQKAHSEELFKYIKEITYKGKALKTLNQRDVPSQIEFDAVKEKFSDEIVTVHQKVDAIKAGASAENITDRDNAYLRFETAVGDFEKAANEFREIQSAFGKEDAKAFAQSSDKNKWFDDKLANASGSDKGKWQTALEAYNRLSNARKGYATSIYGIKGDRLKNEPGQYGVYSDDILKEAQKYVFRVSYVDDKGEEQVITYNRNKRGKFKVLKGRNVNPNTGAYGWNLFDSIPDDFSKLSEVSFFEAPGMKPIDVESRFTEDNNSVLVSMPKETVKKAHQFSAKAQKAKEKIRALTAEKPQETDQFIYSSIEEVNSAFDEIMQTTESRIADANNEVEAARIVLEENKEKYKAANSVAKKTHKKVSSYQGDKSKKEQTTQISTPKYDAALREMDDARTVLRNVEQIASNPTDSSLWALVKDVPECIKTLASIANEKVKLDQLNPSTYEEVKEINTKKEELSAKEKDAKNIASQWLKSVQVDTQTKEDEARKHIREAIPELVTSYQSKIIELIGEAANIDGQLKLDPANATELRTEFSKLSENIISLTEEYMKFLSEFSVTTTGTLGNSSSQKLDTLEKIIKDPLNKTYWNEFDDQYITLFQERYDLFEEDRKLTQQFHNVSEDEQKRIRSRQAELALAFQTSEKLIREVFKVDDFSTSKSGVFSGLNLGKDVSDSLLQSILQRENSTIKAGYQEAIDADYNAQKELDVAEQSKKIAQDELNNKEAVLLVEKELLKMQQERRNVALEIVGTNDDNKKQELLTNYTQLTKKYNMLLKEQSELEKEITIYQNPEEAIDKEQLSKRISSIKNNISRITSSDYTPRSTTTTVDPEKAAKDLQEQAWIIIDAAIDDIEAAKEELQNIATEKEYAERRLKLLKVKKDSGEEKTKTQERAIASYVNFTASQHIANQTDEYKSILEEVKAEIDEQLESGVRVIEAKNAADYDESYQRIVQANVEKRLKEFVKAQGNEKAILQAAQSKQQDAINALDERSNAERDYIARMEEEKKNAMQMAGITQEQIDARRQSVEAILEETKAAQNNTKAISSTQAQKTNHTSSGQKTDDAPTTGDGHDSNFSGATTDGSGYYLFDTSGLARQDTLAAIYQLLSGDNSHFGLTDSERKAIQSELNDIEAQLSGEGLGSGRKSKLNIEYDTFFNDIKKYYQDVDDGNKIFREFVYNMRDGKITEGKWGIYKSSRLDSYKNATGRGHLHPNDLLWSTDDIQNIITRKNGSSLYNYEELYTPIAKYVIDDIQSIPEAILNKILEDFKTLEAAYENGQITSGVEQELKQSVLESYLPNNYSTINTSNQLGLGSFYSKDEVDEILEYLTFVNKNSNSKGKTKEIENKLNDLQKNIPTFDPKENTFEDRMLSNYGYREDPSVAIQNAIDSGKSVSFGDVEDLVTKMYMLCNANYSKDSLIGQVKRAVDAGKDKSDAEKQQIIKEITPLLKSLFGENTGGYDIYKKVEAAIPEEKKTPQPPEQPKSKESEQVPITPEIEQGAVAEKVKENISETPAKVDVKTEVKPETEQGAYQITLKDGSVQYADTQDEYDYLVELYKDQILDPIVTATEQVAEQTETEAPKVDDNFKPVQVRMEDGSIGVAETQEELDFLKSLGAETIDHIEEVTDVAKDKIKEEQNEPETTVKDTDALTARKAELQKMLANDDVFRSTARDNQTSSGGLVDVVRRLATEDTLNKLLQTVSQKGGFGYGGRRNSAEDLYNKLQSVANAGARDKHERVAYIDLATGTLSESGTGEYSLIDTSILNGLRKEFSVDKGFTTQIHTHVEDDDTFFSGTDLKKFASDFETGIKKQILLTKDNITFLDLSAVESAEKVEDVLKNIAEAGQSVDVIKEAIKDSGAVYESKNFSEINADELAKLLGVSGAKKSGSNKKKFTNAIRTEIAGVNSVKNQYNKIIGTFFDSNKPDFVDSNKVKEVVDYRIEYQALIDLYNEFKQNNTLNDADVQTTLAQESAKVQALGKKAQAALQEVDKLKQLVNQSGGYEDKYGEYHKIGSVFKELTEQQTDSKNLEQTMRNYLDTLGFTNVEHVKFNDKNQTLTASLRTSNKAVSDLVMQYNDATKALYLYRAQERESLTGMPAFINGFTNKINAIMQYVASITSIYSVINQVKQGIQYVKEIDSALTELKKVTDETEKTYDNFLKTAAKTADKVGSTIKEIVSSTADWARLNI